MGKRLAARLLCELRIDDSGDKCGKAARTVTVNLAESPLGWLLSRGFVTARQFEAGERLRSDWERGQPSGRSRRGACQRPDASGVQLDAKRRFEAAIETAGSGLSDILWRIVCAGEGMREAETALGWPARAGKLVLAFALDRVADYYRIR